MPKRHSFTSRIVRQGVNFCVSVPTEISEALKSRARAGRISVAGDVNGARFHSTLMPIGGGGHRLFLNGGVRKAAGVGLGDRVKVELQPVAPGNSVPPDLAARLNSESGAREAFEALAASHRRELVRHIEDARGRQNRRKRIEEILGQALGRQTSPARRATGKPQKPLWTCSRCGNRFVNKNQYHSCARYRVEDVLKGKPEKIADLYHRFVKMVEACGPGTTVAYRQKVAFMVRVRFAGATPRQRWLEVGLWLSRRLESPRFRRVETISPQAHIYRLRVARPEELDEELRSWLRESYAIGCQEHLGRT